MRSQPSGVKPKIRGRKLRIGIDWQGALKQKCINKGLREFRSWSNRRMETTAPGALTVCPLRHISVR